MSLALLAALLVLMTLLIRQGLRPLEDMAREADAIAAGDLTRRVRPDRGRRGDRPPGPGPQRDAGPDRDGVRPAGRGPRSGCAASWPTPPTSCARRSPPSGATPSCCARTPCADAEARDRALSRIEQEAARMGALVGDLAVLAREGEGPEPARYRVDLAARGGRGGGRRPDHRRDPVHRARRPRRGPGGRATMPAWSRWCTTWWATPWPTPRRGPRSRWGWPVDGDQAVLEVRDPGPGMNPDQAGHVFDRFYRGDGDRLDGGSGLGLFIVASLARTFGGRPRWCRHRGRGATFTVTLPLFPDTAPTPRPRSPPAGRPDPPGTGPTPHRCRPTPRRSHATPHRCRPTARPPPGRTPWRRHEKNPVRGRPGLD